ncbi:metallophosphoesterase [Parabacteroides sp.]
MKTKLILSLILLLGMIKVSAQVYPVRAQLADKNSFSMILLPDPQSYIKFDANQPLFELQTAWVVNNMDSLNIKGVLCTGDLVEQNEIRIPDGVNGNQTSEEQWKAASRAFERLDNKVSYVICTGNHDYGYEKSENRLCHFPDYFPSERNSCWKKSLVEVGNNYKDIPTLENAAYEFETDTWGKILVISLEFAPRDEAIAWAKKVTEKPKYKDHKVILLTHSYLTWDGKRHVKENYKVSPANYGEAIWQKLVYPSSNICMVLCGHECEIAGYKDNVSFRIDKNAAGKEIPQMMFNAQTADGQWHGNGGDGWLRILEFMPDGQTIQVKTFSPLFALSPLTSDKAWRTESYDQFDITIK